MSFIYIDLNFWFTFSILPSLRLMLRTKLRAGFVNDRDHSCVRVRRHIRETPFRLDAIFVIIRRLYAAVLTAIRLIGPGSCQRPSASTTIHNDRHFGNEIILEFREHEIVFDFIAGGNTVAYVIEIIQ